ncbi:MBOAT family O-acyltransferase [Alteromonas facilis]|uniref:MBOAT family O-acyltransferase n=1 Tax=Alteromonas facilis TaxID=2048004 RepID=UPI000C28C206|nr:MBOAT family protein [Alteromonas facilis]
MVFSSSIFLFFFLPLFLACYYLTPLKYRSLTILVGSYAFYAWWRVDFVLLFFAVTLWNYYIGKAIYSSLLQHKDKAKKVLTIGLIGNLSTLGYFKYANFGVENFNNLLISIGSEPLSLSHVILPIGISFYIFQAISYLIDVYRGDTPPCKRFMDFAAFIALFPQLIAGPVLRYKDLAGQFQDRIHDWGLFCSGCFLFMQGFAKKVLIADSVAPLADAAFAGQAITMLDNWIGILAYSIQLYFDFSGYSDMAIGLGLMMGFRFIQNFNQPYISQSITEFWRRWHISLSTWLRDYLYISLGGNRNGTIMTYRNLFLTMLLGGLWHGANWTFIVWGAWHGALLAIERFTGLSNYTGFSFIRWGITLVAVMIGWVFFRAESVTDAVDMIAAMFTFDSSGISTVFAVDLNKWALAMLLSGIAIILVQGLRQHSDLIESMLSAEGVRRFSVLLKAPVFLLALTSLVASDYSPFLYFQF